MKQFEMKNGRIAKKLYNKVKFRFPRWRRFQWIWHGLWAILLALQIWGITDLYEGEITSSFLNDVITFVLCMG
ncbi:MAG: hypothetical protein K2N81_05865, partial [Acetatifactor sp.]|nr:hypothetical protein [Acetatifactor sp.]